MFSVLHEIGLGQLGVLVNVQLEELAIDDIEVLVREVIQDFVDISLFIDVHTSLEEVGFAYLA